jgi:hypothetical protein
LFAITKATVSNALGDYDDVVHREHVGELHITE